MPYDFDKPVDRRNTHSLKWDVKEHELPMWVADMDFQTAPAWLFYGKRVACFLYRSGSGYFQYGTQADHSRRKCAGTDTGLQYFLPFHCE